MAISDWPADERPREKLLLRGPDALSDAELLAIFLRTGVTGKSAVDLARELLTHFGGLRPLLQANQPDFCRARGLGSAKYAQLQAVLEMGRRHLAATLERGEAITSPSATRSFLSARLRDYPFEVFACLFLDNRHRVVAFEELFRGTIDGASVHPREVVRRVLHHNAAAAIARSRHIKKHGTKGAQSSIGRGRALACRRSHHAPSSGCARPGGRSCSGSRDCRGRVGVVRGTRAALNTAGHRVFPTC